MDYRWIQCVVAIAVATGGCGESGPVRYAVEGTVTFNGQPLEGGEIIFVPLDGASQPDGGRIEAGRFSFLSLPGKKRVEIRAERDHPTVTVAGIEPGTRIPAREQYLPAEYNDASNLSVEVMGPEDGPFEFVLDPKPQ